MAGGFFTGLGFGLAGGAVKKSSSATCAPAGAAIRITASARQMRTLFIEIAFDGSQ
jgi:hypothetical protein